MHIINDRYQAHKDFLERIPEILESQGEVIKDGRNLVKRLVMPDGTAINVKRYHAPHWLNIPIYSFGLSKPKGQRAYEYAAILRSKGIDTPEPIAYFEERRAHLLGLSYFISLQCPYPHEFYELGDAPAAFYQPLTLPFAQFVAHMHSQGILHLDFSPGNILWEQTESGYHFSVVDINRMYFGPVDIKRGCANFARLWGPKQFIIDTVSQYARLRHFDPDEALHIALSKRAAFWRRYRRRHPVRFNLEL